MIGIYFDYAAMVFAVLWMFLMIMKKSRFSSISLGLMQLSLGVAFYLLSYGRAVAIFIIVVGVLTLVMPFVAKGTLSGKPVTSAPGSRDSSGQL
ncbi:MAG: hypothetical protein M3126_01810 [Candidatus Eremiobacteraeota bacterium]|nr:hypothetical protein [Candidatus Eremiobacteraeota bacterium]